MSRATLLFITSFLFLALPLQQANAEPEKVLPQSLSRPSAAQKPITVPAPPSLNAKAYILIDVYSGKIIAEKNSDKRLPPASLTKMMTLYVISSALQNQQLSLTDTVRISQKAWKTGGSRMFVKEGESVAVENLLKGIIVASGNDACVAMAEHLSGSEKSFTDLMNQQAELLGMTNSHFTDSTGLPHSELYSSAKDLAILGRALIMDFPQYYHWYKQKWFTYNGIRQPNRNRLLWRDKQMDGIKTGHTDKAGYCMVSSAKHDNMRLLAVVLGAPNESSRADDSERLLNYGFRFYETHKLYADQQTVTELKLYKGTQSSLNAGLHGDQYITIPSGQYQRLSVQTKVPAYLQSPVKKGDKVGDLIIKIDENIIETKPLYALESVPTAGFFKRAKDSVSLTFKNWFGS